MTFSTISRFASRTLTAGAGAAVALAAAGAVFASGPAQAATAAPKAAAQETARQMIQDAGQFQCFSNIVEHESGWNHTATNPSSGAYGLVQALPASKMASAGADWQTNPATQIKWGLDYMKERYGSPCGAWTYWQAHKSY
ncbi:transglycosylase SLT domain-containing protein [Streptomyces sp. I05A-00742]|uniref:aggregation-promoting factor C-terminal-like domain-containing protein n=1 Tax=Streptomyces sp. I05A-00742 TaxID=2732853 RepID=UPI001488C8D5|nr:transglycosylase SLT domain-containing protein [Streptomyces sp. I05A-00742]